MEEAYLQQLSDESYYGIALRSCFTKSKSVLSKTEFMIVAASSSFGFKILFPSPGAIVSQNDFVSVNV